MYYFRVGNKSVSLMIQQSSLRKGETQKICHAVPAIYIFFQELPSGHYIENRRKTGKLGQIHTVYFGHV